MSLFNFSAQENPIRSTTSTSPAFNKLVKVYMRAGLSYQQAVSAAYTSLGEVGYEVTDGYSVPRRSIHSY